MDEWCLSHGIDPVHLKVAGGLLLAMVVIMALVVVAILGLHWRAQCRRKNMFIRKRRRKVTGMSCIIAVAVMLILSGVGLWAASCRSFPPM